MTTRGLTVRARLRSAGFRTTPMSISNLSAMASRIFIRLPITGGEPTQLTSGQFEVSDVRLSQDKTKFYFTSSEGSFFQRHLFSMPVGGGTANPNHRTYRARTRSIFRRTKQCWRTCARTATSRPNFISLPISRWTRKHPPHSSR